MKIEKHDLINFENNKQYIVIDIIEENNNKYFYFSALDEKTLPRFMIMKEAKEQGEFVFSKLESEEFENIKTKFSNKMLFED